MATKGQTQLALGGSIWPSELQNPAEVLGGGLNAEERITLAEQETPFVITDAERFYWQDGKPAVRFTLIIAPNSENPAPWEASVALGLNVDADPEKPGDRERIMRYFEEMGENARPIGPFVAVLVKTDYPQPYWAIRKASKAIMARYAIEPTMQG